jgi:hypothetical protein
VTSDYDFYLLDSMHSYVNYFNPLNLIDNGITVGRANYSENRRHIGPECRSNQDWRFGEDKTIENYLQRLDDWNPYDKVYNLIEEKKGEFLSDPRIKEAFKRLTLYKRNKKFTIDDGELVFERVMSGDPEYWQKTVRKKIKKGIRILLNFAQNANEGPEVFAANTVDMFKIAYVFELMGVPVQIIAGEAAKGAVERKSYSGVFFMLKSEGEQINLKKAALLACPGMLRCHSFAAGAVLFTGEISYGYGHAQAAPDAYKQLADVDFIVGKGNHGDKVIEELLKVVENV